jgi:dienelactone hydrolase
MKIRKRTLKIVFLVLIILLVGYFAFKYFNKDPYLFQGNSFSYEHRRIPGFSQKLLSHNGSLEIYSIQFKSRKFLDSEATVYGLLVMPQGKNVPGLVLLPGGGVTKESELPLALKIADLGYAVLTIDQRGVGETDGLYPPYEQDYQYFLQGKEPIQHLSVYDALASFDILSSIKNVDKNSIGIIGESMGGRYAMIAAALEPRITGFIGISTAGFNMHNSQGNPYLFSIDPDKYIAKISPRPFFMMHSVNDTKVSIENAQITFNLAQEPKKFYTVEGSAHGYSDAMYDELKESLSNLFGKP